MCAAWAGGGPTNLKCPGVSIAIELKLIGLHFRRACLTPYFDRHEKRSMRVLSLQSYTQTHTSALARTTGHTDWSHPPSCEEGSETIPMAQWCGGRGPATSPRQGWRPPGCKVMLLPKSLIGRLMAAGGDSGPTPARPACPVPTGRPASRWGRMG